MDFPEDFFDARLDEVWKDIQRFISKADGVQLPKQYIFTDINSKLLHTLVTDLCDVFSYTDFYYLKHTRAPAFVPSFVVKHVVSYYESEDAKVKEWVLSRLIENNFEEHIKLYRQTDAYKDKQRTRLSSILYLPDLLQRAYRYLNWLADVVKFQFSEQTSDFETMKSTSDETLLLVDPNSVIESSWPKLPQPEYVPVCSVSEMLATVNLELKKQEITDLTRRLDTETAEKNKAQERVKELEAQLKTEGRKIKPNKV